MLQIPAGTNKHKPASEDEGRKSHNLEARSQKFTHNL